MAAERELRSLGGDPARAQESCQWAVRLGVLTRPDRCEKCGKVAKVHGHHEDYDKPLDVQWLCPSCHRLRHSNGQTPKKQLGQITADVLDRVDAYRGEVPRTRFVEVALEHFMLDEDAPPEAFERGHRLKRTTAESRAFLERREAREHG